MWLLYGSVWDDRQGCEVYYTGRRLVSLVCVRIIHSSKIKQFPLGTRRCCDVESTSLTLIQRRNNVVCPLGNVGGAKVYVAGLMLCYRLFISDVGSHFSIQYSQGR